MAKKKQLAGKTTKLAKLPLTQALAEQSEEAGRHLPPVPLSHGAAEPLGAIYLHLIRELTSLLSELRVPEDSLPPHQTYLPPHIPKPQQLRQSLRNAQQGLRELHQLLSRP
ncbi:MAG: hypothetical protein NTY36_14230 [Deltaproteobacteria bacterium]|nr:hypothetical protein [Deltaproteobacteria bacterium]